MPHDDPLIARSVQVYRMLLRLYPRDHREAYGPLMIQLFKDCLRDAYRTDGVAGIVLYWLSTLLDVVISVIEEYREGGFTMSFAILSRFRAPLMMLGGLCLAISAYSQLQPGSHYNFYGWYGAAMALLGPGFLLFGLGLAGTYVHLRQKLGVTGRLALAIAMITALLMGTTWMLPALFESREWLWILMMGDALAFILSVMLFGIVLARRGERWAYLFAAHGLTMLGFLLYPRPAAAQNNGEVLGPLWGDFSFIVAWGIIWMIAGYKLRANKTTGSQSATVAA